MERIKNWVESSRRPPALRTNCTYDDDELFANAALNMISRYDALGLTPQATICAVLPSPRDRWSFLEGLNSRLQNPSRCSPSANTLVQRVEMTFGSELKRLVYSESNHSHDSKSSGGSQSNTPKFYNKCPGVGNHNVTGHSEVPRSKPSRRFFPDTECLSKTFFRSKRVENIDWHLVEAIEQVNTLCLDGMESNKPNNNTGYCPPMGPMRHLGMS